MRSIAGPPSRAAEAYLYICIAHVDSSTVSLSDTKLAGHHAAQASACSCSSAARSLAPSRATAPATAAAVAGLLAAGQSFAMCRAVTSAPSAVARVTTAVA